jgi:hypothetical protein
MKEVVLSVLPATEAVVVIVFDPVQWLYVDPQPYFSDEL